MNKTSSASDLADNLNHLLSEQPNPDSAGLDSMTAHEILRLINQQDQTVAPAVARAIDQIAPLVERLATNLRQGGRLIYAGAGTSGRIGILDAVECPPTFSTPPSMVQGIIAGGNQAVWQAVEGAEDNETAGRQAMRELNLTAKDSVIGIAASGRTPWVKGVLNAALDAGATTGAISSNANAEIFKLAEFQILTEVGAEVITGSSRMKSGTAQKLVLNMISTSCMVLMGKTFGNLMVDLSASNEKLKARSINILRQITGCSASEAENTLRRARGDLKPAVLMWLNQLDFEAAETALEEAGGNLRRAIEKTANR